MFLTKQGALSYTICYHLLGNNILTFTVVLLGYSFIWMKFGDSAIAGLFINYCLHFLHFVVMVGLAQQIANVYIHIHIMSMNLHFLAFYLNTTFSYINNISRLHFIITKSRRLVHSYWNYSMTKAKLQ